MDKRSRTEIHRPLSVWYSSQTCVRQTPGWHGSRGKPCAMRPRRLRRT